MGSIRVLHHPLLALPKFDLLLAAGLLVVPGRWAAQVIGRLAVHCTALPPRNRTGIYIEGQVDCSSLPL